jgi:hypothetical protein
LLALLSPCCGLLAISTSNTFELVQDPTLGLVCEQYALFVGPTAIDGQPLERDDGKKGTTNLLQFLKKDVLDGLALEYFADGGRKLAERFVVGDDEELNNRGPLEDVGEEPTERWIIVPLPNEETAEGPGEHDEGSEASPLPSPILMMEFEEDPLLSSFDLMDEEGGGLGAPVNEQSVQPDDSGRDTRLSWLPNLFAKRDNIAVVVFADNDDENRDYTHENEMDEEAALKPSLFLGTKSKELMTIRNGEAVACHKLPAVPLSMYVHCLTAPRHGPQYSILTRPRLFVVFFVHTEPSRDSTTTRLFWSSSSNATWSTYGIKTALCSTVYRQPRPAGLFQRLSLFLSYL